MTTMIVEKSPSPSSPEADSRTKAKRQSKPKVKTGCTNCKKRRIKCDESRPVCNNCVKSKRTCVGYPAPSRKANYAPNILPRPPLSNLAAAPALRPAPTLAAAPNLAAAPAHRPTPNLAVAPVPNPQPQSQKLVQLPRRAEKRIRLLHGLAKPGPISGTGPPVAQMPLPPAPPISPAHMQIQPMQPHFLYQPSLMTINEGEAMYFQLFRSSTASELSGYFDAGFWTKSVLQGAEIEPAIRHAVIALGALYKTLEKSTESPPTSPQEVINLHDTPRHHWSVAITHYSGALTEMSTAKLMERQSIRTQLMANVLLACFDSFIGDHKQAVGQINTGMKLLAQLRYQYSNQLYSDSKETVDQDLIRMFTRLAIQAKTYDMAFHFPEPDVVRLIPPGAEVPLSPLSENPEPPASALPVQFVSLVEARIAWDQLVYKIFCFREALFQASNGPIGLLPPTDIKRYGESFHQELLAWGAAFEPLFQVRHSPGIDAQVKAGTATLKTTYIMTYILFVMTSQHSEMAFDNYTPYFQDIIDLALEVVADQERRAAVTKGCHPENCIHKQFKMDIFNNSHSDLLTYHIKPSFSADMGIVQPIYVVATKCRDATTRRKAIQLLKNSARREAMWDSEMCAHIGQWIVDIEEEDFPSQQYHQQQQPFDVAHRVSVASDMTGSCAGSVAKTEYGGDASGNGSWNNNSGMSPPPTILPTRVVPDEKRVMVTAVEMDLRGREATIRCGTRGIKKGAHDERARSKKLWW